MIKFVRVLNYETKGSNELFLFYAGGGKLLARRMI